MKISLGMNLQSGPWGGGNRFGHALVAALRARGVAVVHDLHDPDIDLIVLADPRIDLQITAYNHFDVLHYLRRVNPRAVVVHRINECDERKGQQGQVNPLLRQATRIADHQVFVSDWLRRLHLAQGMASAQNSVILNGSDAGIFNADGHQPWAGAFPVKLVTHHWGVHPLKGFAIYQQLDRLPHVELTYIGHLPQGVTFSQHVPPLTGAALAAEIKKHDVYVTASQFEPGSNHQNEGALCGLPLLYIDQASMPEYCRGYGVAFTPENVAAKLDELLQRYHEFDLRAYPHTAARATAQYADLFSAMHAERETILARRAWPQVITGDDPAVWLRDVRAPVLGYLRSLAHDLPGRYAPAHEGVTEQGAALSLPYSLWALACYHELDETPPDLAAWLAFIAAFQVQEPPPGWRIGAGAFVDPALLAALRGAVRRLVRWRARLGGPFSAPEIAIQRLTGLAIDTLAAYKIPAPAAYRGFPTTARALNRALRASATDAVRHMAVFVAHEAPRFLPQAGAAALRATSSAWIASAHDPHTGGYARGLSAADPVARMVASAPFVEGLTTLGEPLHSPQRLLDDALTARPADLEALLATVTVLRACAAQTNHRRAEVAAQAAGLIPVLQAHFNPLDGGFMWFAASAARYIEGVRIMRARPASDLGGTWLACRARAHLLALMSDVVEGQTPHNPPGGGLRIY
ncbi:MAG: hypothetical protein ACLFTK_11770 [Anaerolineales bacterium]